MSAWFISIPKTLTVFCSSDGTFCMCWSNHLATCSNSSCRSAAASRSAASNADSNSTNGYSVIPCFFKGSSVVIHFAFLALPPKGFGHALRGQITRREGSRRAKNAPAPLTRVTLYDRAARRFPLGGCRGNISAARSAPAGLVDVRLPSRCPTPPIRAGLASGPLS